MKRLPPITRRDFLHGAAALSAYAALNGCGSSIDPGPAPGMPGSRPFRGLPEGTDTLP